MLQVDKASWPAVSVADAFKKLTEPDMPFEMETCTVRGRSVRVYKKNLPSLREVIEQSRIFGDREFLVFQDDRLTFDAHFRAVSVFARVLTDRYGVKKGDRVAIAMRNYPEWSVVFWATVALGAVATPLNAWGTGDDLRYAIRDAGCRVVVTDAERLMRLLPLKSDISEVALIATRTPVEKLEGTTSLESLIGTVQDYANLPVEPLPIVSIDPDDDATIFYTSGTTGRPKGALGTHRNIITNILNSDFPVAFMALRRGDKIVADDPLSAPQKSILLPAPFFHVTGCHSTLVTAMVKGRKIVLMYKWAPDEALELIERERITNTTGVPAMVWQLLESDKFGQFDLSSIEGVSYGGSSAAPELTLRVSELFRNVFPRQGYGATETSSVTSSNCGEDYLNRPTSVGPAAPACDVKIVREDGTDAPTGAAGEIWIYGPNVVKGYWNNPDATADAFVDGWYRTGDIGRLDEDGFIYVLDRIKDMVIRGGENIYCAEVEAALFTHDSVLDAAVFGIPDRVLGEEVVAVVRLKENYRVTEDELRAYLRTAIAIHKVPRMIAVRYDEFPRNASGKTLKRELREWIVAGTGCGEG